MSVPRASSYLIHPCTSYFWLSLISWYLVLPGISHILVSRTSWYLATSTISRVLVFRTSRDLALPRYSLIVRTSCLIPRTSWYRVLHGISYFLVLRSLLSSRDVIEDRDWSCERRGRNRPERGAPTPSDVRVASLEPLRETGAPPTRTQCTNSVFLPRGGALARRLTGSSLLSSRDMNKDRGCSCERRGRNRPERGAPTPSDVRLCASSLVVLRGTGARPTRARCTNSV